MSNRSGGRVSVTASEKMKWLPIIVLALGQILIAANIASLSISIGAIVNAFKTSAASIQSAVVVYSLLTAAVMILGGKLGALFGSLRVFRAAVIVYGAAMAGIALSPGTTMLIISEAVAGLAAAVLVPSLVALIAANYQGKQRALAIGVLGAAGGIGGSVAMLIAGFVGGAWGWQIAFWIIVAVAVLILVLSPTLKSAPRKVGVTIDWLGVLFSALAIVLLTLGVNFIGSWGFFLAKPAAPFSLLGLSPTLVMLVAGVLLGGAFFSVQKRRVARSKTPLLSPEVIDSKIERMTVFAVLVLTAAGAGVTFLLPLYNQIVQGASAIGTAIALLPYTLSLFAAAILVAKLIGPLSVRQIGRYGFLVLAVGLVLCGVAIQNEWSSIFVIISLVLVGVGVGGLMTVFSNVLVSASPPELAGEVGGLRGTVTNLGGAIGTALAGVILTIVLVSALAAGGAQSTVISDSLKQRVDLSKVSFVSNKQLEAAIAATPATPAEAAEAVRIYTDSRLKALKISLFSLAAIALLGLLFTGGLPTKVQKPGADSSDTGKKPASDTA